MKSISSILVLITLKCLATLCVSQDFDFFYFVEQWPGSYCDSKKSCCYPVTGKPIADFGIHGLWPNYKNGSYPSNCDPDSAYDETKIRDLLPTMQRTWPTLACPSGNGTAFWSHEWEKHGTCSESILTQHEYFESSLALKSKTHLLQVLTSAGITPNDGFYSLSKIKDAIKRDLGHDVFIECNVDSEGNSQLYQVYTCVDTSGAEIRDLLPTMQRTWPTLACPSGDGTTFWSHEWEKHGTCSESILTQRNYFQSALALKRQTNLLQILTSAGITPNDGFYSMSKIKDAIKRGLGQDVFIECNVDSEGNSQLYQVYTCVDTSGAEVIECPVFPRGRCGSSIQFPSF